MIALPRHLRGRLLLSHLVVAAATLGTVLVGVSLVGPGYFAEAMGHATDDPHGPVMDALTLAAFDDAMRTALLAAALTALIAAVMVSLAVSGRIAGPVSRLAAAAHRVAAGHYAERVPSVGDGEVAELADAFNVMSGSLEQDERRRLQLVGDVAHELRTPLTTLDGYLEGLEDGVIQADSETWQLLRRETGRLNRLVGDLAELWRAEARQLPLHPDKIEVNPILDEVAERFRPDAAARGMTVEVEPTTALTTWADRDRVVQMVSSYLSNAVRYAPDGSRVRLAASASDLEVVIRVGDEGPGLATDELERLFERFYRVDPSRSRALGGAGIGLAITRAVAEAMNGRAWAESDGPGRGSTFLIALPAA
ncbi:MAG TPA: ATP-binding protein [Candidatus Limnocylindria bacterium]|jgi:signal transduction histidine kinase